MAETCNCVAAVCAEYGCCVAAGFSDHPLVEPIPDCSRCSGRGTLGGATQSAIVEPWPCPDCRGTGAALRFADGAANEVPS